MSAARACAWVVILALVGCGDDATGEGAPVVDAGPDDGPFVVDFVTTAGSFAIEVDPAWAPLGAARFRELVAVGFYDGSRFFRVVPGFVVQFGLAADPATTATWQNRRIEDDPVTQSNTRGYVSFATAGADTRTTQVFINYGDNAFLDSMGFAPFGRVVEGMDRVDAINDEHGQRPDQGRISREGNPYLDAEFPGLTAIDTATIR